MREVTDATFEQEVLQADRPVVVDFWAPWCRPCHTITPILQSLEEEAGNRAVFTKLNVDVHPGAASRYGVLAIPTVIVFADGEPKETVVGARPRSHYEESLRKVLPAAELDRNAVAE
ncbi:MAG TPA: thioredoxin [Gaiellaceae bacterium]|nr:thioredoxin [Gaiellaceae bacterium]